jgi:hypothetical protein
MADSGKSHPAKLFSGRPESSDPTNEPGQYPPAGVNASLFGGPLPTGTGAPGTPGARGGADATNEPGQVSDGLTGITDAQITETGAPGTTGAQVQDGGPDTVTYTQPNAGINPYTTETTSAAVSGPDDWTTANDAGYATGGPQLPGIKGNEPQAGESRFQPGGGHVMRGGRAVRG